MGLDFAHKGIAYKPKHFRGRCERPEIWKLTDGWIRNKLLPFNLGNTHALNCLLTIVVNYLADS